MQGVKSAYQTELFGNFARIKELSGREDTIMNAAAHGSAEHMRSHLPDRDGVKPSNVDQAMSRRLIRRAIRSRKIGITQSLPADRAVVIAEYSSVYPELSQEKVIHEELTREGSNSADSREWHP